MKKNFTTACVIAILVQAFIYAWISLFLSYKIGTEISPTTACAFFAFCCGEVGACSLIKSMKVKHSNDNIDSCDFENLDDTEDNDDESK